MFFNIHVMYQKLFTEKFKDILFDFCMEFVFFHEMKLIKMNSREECDSYYKNFPTGEYF